MPSQIEIIREAIDIMWGPSGASPEMKATPDDEILDFYTEYSGLLAGPIQDVIGDHWNLGDPNVAVPKDIQGLFMDANAVLAEQAAMRAEREDELMRQLEEEKIE